HLQPPDVRHVVDPLRHRADVPHLPEESHEIPAAKRVKTVSQRRSRTWPAMLTAPVSRLTTSTARKRPIQTSGKRTPGKISDPANIASPSRPMPTSPAVEGSMRIQRISRLKGGNVRQKVAVTKIAGITVENASDASRKYASGL